MIDPLPVRHPDAASPRHLENASILLVDDQEEIVLLFTEMLKREGFRNIVGTTDAREAIRLFAERRPDIVLLDLRMPGVDGFEVLGQMRSLTQPGEHLPILMLTADASIETKRQALAAGATDFLTKPFDASEAVLRIKNSVTTRFLYKALAVQNEVLEDQVRIRTAHLEDAIGRLATSEEATKAAVLEMIRRLAAAAEFRDEETGWHIERMSRYSALLAARCGIDEPRCEMIRLASSMHDVGKIGTPDRILLKEGPLTPEEIGDIRRHAQIGYEILSGSGAEVVQLAATIALTHHERFDGQGYPRGLARDAIPLEGRIAAVADVFDALTSDRVYRKAFSIDQAVEMMRAESGKHFDPDVLSMFLGSMNDVVYILYSYADLDMEGSVRREPPDHAGSSGSPQDLEG